MSDSVTEEKLVPPRFWWLRRIACAAAAWLLVLIAVRVWWGWEADRRLRAAIEARRAAGEPVLLQDFVRPPIPDEDNAAYFLEQAARAFRLPPGVKSIGQIDPRDQSESHNQIVSKLLELNKETLRLVAAARDCPGADWKVRLSSPTANILLPHLRPMRDLARLEVIAVATRHDEGDDAGALEAIEDTLKIGATVADEFVISHLVRIVLDDLACGTLEAIVPTMRIKSDAVGAGVLSPAAGRSQVERLIDVLLEEGGYRRSWVRALQVERLFQIDTAEAVLAGRVSPAIFVPSFSVPRAYTVPLRPAYTLDELFMFESTSRLVDAAGMADWPAAAAYVPLPREADIWEWVSSGPQYVDRALHMVSSRLLPSFGSVMRDSFRTLANRRMAAVALAIRLYEVDHGARPDRLDDLVPEYLPAVPRDPFAADGRALGYLPGAAPPVLYSVNVDGVDDGGCFELTAYGAIERDRADMPYFLNGDRPRAMIASPATQPASAPAGAARQSASKPASPAHSSASTQPVPASMQAVPDDHEIENAQGDQSR